MVIYDWQCNRCGGVFEEMATPIEECQPCPNCGGVADKVFTKVPLMSYSNRPKERPWGTSRWRGSRKKGGRKDV